MSVRFDALLTNAQAQAVLNAVGFDNGKHGVRSSKVLQDAYERIAAAIAADMERTAAREAATCPACGRGTDGGARVQCTCPTSTDGIRPHRVRTAAEAEEGRRAHMEA